MIAPASNVGLKPGPTGEKFERPAKEPTTTTTMSVLTCTLCAVGVAGRQKHHTSKANLPQQPAERPKLYTEHNQKGGCAENTVFSNLFFFSFLRTVHSQAPHLQVPRSG